MAPRSCLQAGLYPTRTGCYKNDIPLPQRATTLAHRFRQTGYDTAYIGKWHLAGSEPVTETERGGYQYWRASSIIEFTSEPYHTVVYDEDNDPVRLPGYRVDALTDAAIRYVDAHQDRPFYLFVSLLEPHHQNQTDTYPAPERYAERYAGLWMPPDLAKLGGTASQHLAGYWGQIKRIDEAFERLLESLRSLGLRENTVVVFASDHGNHFKTRNDEYKRSPAREFDPRADRTPGTRLPGRRKRRAARQPTGSPPTLLDAAGLPFPEEMQGRSVLALLNGDREGWPEEVFVQISESQVGRAIRTRRWKYCVVAPEADPREDPTA